MVKIQKYFVFTKHALERMEQQKVSFGKVLGMLKEGEVVQGTYKDRKEKIFYIRNGIWLFTLQEVKFDPSSGAIIRVITVTNQKTSKRATLGYSDSSYVKQTKAEV